MDRVLAKILEISELRVGTELSQAQVTGDLTLNVYDAGDFSELGGQVEIDDVIYPYNTATEDPDTVVLGSALTEDLAADTEVWLYPASYEKEAMCQVDNEDAVLARVPFSLYGALEDVVRDG